MSQVQPSSTSSVVTPARFVLDPSAFGPVADLRQQLKATDDQQIFEFQKFFSLTKRWSGMYALIMTNPRATSVAQTDLLEMIAIPRDKLKGIIVNYANASVVSRLCEILSKFRENVTTFECRYTTGSTKQILFDLVQAFPSVLSVDVVSSDRLLLEDAKEFFTTSAQKFTLFDCKVFKHEKEGWKKFLKEEERVKDMSLGPVLDEMYEVGDRMIRCPEQVETQDLIRYYQI